MVPGEAGAKDLAPALASLASEYDTISSLDHEIQGAPVAELNLQPWDAVNDADQMIGEIVMDAEANTVRPQLRADLTDRLRVC